MKLTNDFISLNPKFSKKEQQLIIGTLINKISLTTKRSSFVFLRFPKFGTIRTHGNKKRMSKLKYLRRYNKNKWSEKQQVNQYSTKNLLW